MPFQPTASGQNAIRSSAVVSELVPSEGGISSGGGAFVCHYMQCCTFILLLLFVILFSLCTFKVNGDHILIVLNCLRVLCEIRKIHAKYRKRTRLGVQPFAFRNSDTVVVVFASVCSDIRERNFHNKHELDTE